MRQMKKSLLMSLMFAIMIAACSTPAPTLPASVVSTKAPAASQPTAAQPAKPISTEFTPSDPKSVKLNAGKPQFVEFFAFW
jgi:uncharacterized lipoprotein YajG